MLRAHMNSQEQILIAQGRGAAAAGHPNNIGGPRETFVREYLQNHISERAAVGQGEVIDQSSRPAQSRPQIDVVLYRREYPRLLLAAGTHAFLAESVVATIEVKSTLDAAGLEQSWRAAAYLKGLRQSLSSGGMRAGYLPPSILTYVVAYDGPANLSTVYGWLPRISARVGVVQPQLPVGPARLATAGVAVDGVFILGRGFLLLDNQPLLNVVSLRSQHPAGNWIYADGQQDNLLLLFLLLTHAFSGTRTHYLVPDPYASAVSYALSMGP